MREAKQSPYAKMSEKTICFLFSGGSDPWSSIPNESIVRVVDRRTDYYRRKAKAKREMRKLLEERFPGYRRLM